MEQKYFKGDRVVFVFWNGEEEHSLDGTIIGIDIYRNNGLIANIEYDIEGYYYNDKTKKCVYKHIEQKYIVNIVS